MPWGVRLTLRMGPSHSHVLLHAGGAWKVAVQAAALLKAQAHAGSRTSYAGTSRLPRDSLSLFLLCCSSSLATRRELIKRPLGELSELMALSTTAIAAYEMGCA